MNTILAYYCITGTDVLDAVATSWEHVYTALIVKMLTCVLDVGKTLYTLLGIRKIMLSLIHY